MPKHYTKYGHTDLLGDFADRLDAGAVQVSVVLSGLDELMTLNVPLHLLTRHDEVVVATVHLVRPPSARRVYQPITQRAPARSTSLHR